MKLQNGDRSFRFRGIFSLGLALGMLASTNVSGAIAQCTPGACDDNNPCTDDTCDLGTGGCVYTPTNCDDGNVCTVDSCSPGGGPGVATLFIGHDISQLERQYQKNGTFVQTWGALPKATGAAVDGAGVLYICNPSYGNNLIEKRGPGNTNLGTITATVAGQWIEDLGNFGGGYILAGTIEGNVFQIDTTTGGHTLLFSTGQNFIGVTYDGTNIWTTGGYTTTLVSRRDLAGNVLATFNTGQTNAAIGYDPDDGTLWIGHANGQVTHYSQLGVLLGGFATAAGGQLIDGLELANMPIPEGCQHPALDCNDNDPCTDDECDPVTGCFHSPHICDDGNPCTDDMCVPGPGCVSTNNTAACEDSNFCTTGDTCSGGMCQPGAPVICNDGNVCTTDSCDPRTGCAYVNNTDSCDDGNACTIEDACVGGTCNPGVPVACDDGNVCTNDSCDPMTGCVYTNNTSPCDDGNACTTGDVCSGGTCQPGAAVVCSASDPCHVAGICNPVTGLCSNPPAPNGTPCSDGNACTQGDFCEAGTCFGGNPVTCTASDPCHVAGTCNPLTGACSNPAKPDGTACSDGNLCTLADVCVAGACLPGNPVICASIDQCHVAGTCNPGTGSCSNPPAPNGTGCSDGNPCTVGDVCTNGVCAGVTTITPPAETQNLSAAADKSTYIWSPASGATAYDVVRGDVAALPVGSSAGGEVCFENLSAPTLVDPAPPALRAVFWYLVQPRNPCGPGPIGTQSNGTMRVTTTCP